MSSKVCKVCKQEKPHTEFYRSQAYKDGYAALCKSCTREYDKGMIARPKELPPSGEKRCCRCYKTKPIEEFHRRPRNSDGLRSECKECTRRQEHDYRRRKPEQQYFACIRQKYGLSQEDYFALLARQDGRCAICDGEDERLMVDHCHATGAVRGLLCGNCNAGLGMFGDKINFLEGAIKYLKEHYDRMVSSARS